MRALIMEGRPGCGKGTLSDHIRVVCEERGVPCDYISTGNFFRRLYAHNPWNDLSREVVQNVNLDEMKAGKLLSNEMTMRIVRYLLLEEVHHAGDSDSILIIDGVPRTDFQAMELVSMLKSMDMEVTSIFFNTPREVCLERLSKRLGERADDSEEHIREHRQDIWEKHTHQVRTILKDAGAYFDLHGENSSPENIMISIGWLL